MYNGPADAVAGSVCRRYVDRLMLLPSNATTLADKQFIFSGRNLFSAVSLTPLVGDFRPRSDDSVDSGAAPFVQFNISSTSSG